MFLKQLITVLFFCSLYTSFSQTDPKVITSPIYEHKNPRIYVQEMLGEENGIYYVLYSTQPVKTSTLPSLHIGMYANEDMLLIRSQKLIPDNPDDPQRYKNFLLEKYLLTKNGLIFFFDNKRDKGTRDVYLGTFDLNLNSKKDFEKVLTYDPSQREFIGLANSNYSNTVLATINYVGKDESQFLEFKEIDENFDLISSGKIDIEIESAASGFSRWFYGESTLLNSVSLSNLGKITGRISIRQEVTTSNKRGKEKIDKNADKWVNTIYVMDMKSKTYTEIPIKLDDQKNLEEIVTNTDGNTIYAAGFYSDLTKAKKGGNIQGVFYMRIDANSGKLKFKKATDFPDEFLFRINTQNTLVGLFGKKKAATRENISNNAQISELIINDSKQEITAYCQPINNSVITTTDQNGNTSTTYTSERGSVFFFNMTEDGEFNYFNTIRKYTKWSSSSSAIWNLKSIYLDRSKNGKKDNLLFSTQRIYNEYDKSDIRGKKAKWKKTKRDFSIAAINNKNGNYQLNHPQEYISKDKTNLGLYLNNISQSKGNLYSYGIKRKMRTSRIITAVALLPLVYIVISSPKSYYQKVQLNRIEIKE
jgi:hypothetical protein|tara:strand:+ start:21572 stop:23338 length:1767 start_codon:yes stop_codon:yes gene_type:complete